MKDYQNDKYENFFLNLKASREVLATFGDFTVAAVAAPGVDALVAGHGPALAAAVKDFRQDLVMRRGQGGGSEAGTDAEQTAFAQFKAFIQATDKKVLAGYLYDHPDQQPTYYPDNLSGLTQAKVKSRLTRLEAYTKALEASADAQVQAQGAPARTLLVAYKAASTTKTKARTTLQNTLANLGPAARAVAGALWQVQTAALYTHRADPTQARKYFDYASLPNRVNPKKPKATPKTA